MGGRYPGGMQLPNTIYLHVDLSSIRDDPYPTTSRTASYWSRNESIERNLYSRSSWRISSFRSRACSCPHGNALMPIPPWVTFQLWGSLRYLYWYSCTGAQCQTTPRLSKTISAFGGNVLRFKLRLDGLVTFPWTVSLLHVYLSLIKFKCDSFKTYVNSQRWKVIWIAHFDQLRFYSKLSTYSVYCAPSWTEGHEIGTDSAARLPQELYHAACKLAVNDIEAVALYTVHSEWSIIGIPWVYKQKRNQ